MSGRRSWLGSLLAGAALAGLLGPSGCAPQDPTYAGQRPPSILLPGGPPPAATPARPVAILAPLTGSNGERGSALVRAAQLALAAPGSPALDVRDTGGTPQGAAAAAQAAVSAGAALLLGPLTAPETAAVAPVARTAGVPVLAFTNASAQAQPGIWVLGVTPGQQVDRVVDAVERQGKTRLGAVLPDSEFGRVMAGALSAAARGAGLPPPSIRFHGTSAASLTEAARAVADYATRHPAVADPAAPPAPAASPPPLDAVLLADTGPRLASLAAALVEADVAAPAVRLLGPALWTDPPARGGAAIDGAWFAAPDPAAPARVGFDTAYTAKYGTPAPPLADAAFDAASIARLVGGPDGYPVASLVRPEGFAGVDGPLALDPDGHVRRGLALFEVRGADASVIEPAPQAPPARPSS